jgi:hypothetical protein
LVVLLPLLSIILLIAQLYEYGADSVSIGQYALKGDSKFKKPPPSITAGGYQKGKDSNDANVSFV